MKRRNWDVRRRMGELRWILERTRGARLSLAALAASGVLLSLFGVAFAALTRLLIDRATGAVAGSLAGPAAGLAGLVLAQVLMQTALGMLSPRLALRLENRLRGEIYGHLQCAHWNEVRRHHSGDLLTRMTSDVSTVVGGMTGLLPDTLGLVVRLFAALGYLAMLDSTLACVALAAGPLFLIPSRMFAGRLRELDRESRTSEGRIRGFIQESLRGHAVVKAFGLEDLFTGRLGALHDQSWDVLRRRSWLAAVPGAGLSSGYWAGYLLALVWGATRVQAGRATFGTLTAFLQLVGQVQAPFQGLARSMPRLVTLLASAERIMEIERMDSEAGQDGGTGPAFPAAATGGVDLEFRDVAFTYDRERVLDGVNFTIRAGERVALVGDSGEGKTTVLRLLLGLVRPESGDVRIREAANGGRSWSASRSARRCFAYVPQGNSLLSGTIRENILLGRPGAPPEAAEEAARQASAETFIRALPGGFESAIGENGDGLSEGQAQRIALARALLRDAPVLVLDEATSALDLTTESAVLRHVQALGGSRTVIVVSHRTEARVGCDRVLRVSGGRVVEEANRQEGVQ